MFILIFFENIIDKIKSMIKCVLTVLITYLVLIFIAYVIGYIGGALLNVLIGEKIVIGLNLLLGANRITQESLPLIFATISTLGAVLSTESFKTGLAIHRHLN